MPQINTIDPGARVQTQVRQDTTPQFQGTAGLNVLQGALSGFFNAGQKVLATHEEIQQQENLDRIGRENDALKLEGVASGKIQAPPDQAKMHRSAYHDAYLNTFATSMSDEDAQEFTAFLAEQPQDGTVDPVKIRQKFMADKFGQGSGAVEYDAAYLANFTRATDGAVMQHRMDTVKTERGNAVETLRGSIVGKLQRNEALTDSDLSNLHTNLTTLVGGDRGTANKLFTSILTEGIYTPGQADSVLGALGRNGYADQFPDMYASMSKVAIEKVAHAQNYEAVKSYTALNNEIDATLSKDADPEHIAGLYVKLRDTLQQHGALDQFEALKSKLVRAWGKSVNTKAEVNAMLLAYRSRQPMEAVATAVGKSTQDVLNTYFESTTIGLLNTDLNGQYPDLQAASEGGVLKVWGSPAAAKQAAALFATPQFRDAAAGGMSSNYAALLSRKLTDAKDPTTAANTFQFFQALESATSPEYVKRLLKDDAKTVYDNAVVAGDRAKDFFESRVNAPATTIGRESSKTDWNTLLGDAKTPPMQLKQKVVEQASAAIRKAAGRDPFLFGGDAVVFSDPQAQTTLLNDVAVRMEQQRRLGFEPDLGNVLEQLTPDMRNKFLVIPGAKGTLQVLSSPTQRDPWLGKDKSKPLAVVNGRAVFWPVKIRNYLGEVEDPLDTFRADSKALGSRFAGLGLGGGDISLRLASGLEQDGLFDVMRNDGMPLQLTPGQSLHYTPGDAPHPAPTALHLGGDKTTDGALKLALPFGGKSASQDLKTPTDPSEFKHYVEALLPPGFLLTHRGEFGGSPIYQVVYGFRLNEGDSVDADRILKERDAAYQAAHAGASQRISTGTVNYGNNPAGGR